MVLRYEYPVLFRCQIRCPEHEQRSPNAYLCGTRMKTKVTLLALLWALLACTDDADRPDGLIPPEKMVLILRDVHLGEQQVSQLGLRSQDSSLVVFQTLERRIYKKYGYDTAAYRRSYLYYAARPEAYQQIYRAVIDSLHKGEDRVKTAPAHDPRKPL